MSSVLITGGSRGIGLAIAKYFVSHGYQVFGTKTKESNTSYPEIFSQIFSGDFTNIQDIQTCAAWAASLKPKVLINNAGINRISPFLDLSFADFHDIQSVNLFAPMLISQAVIPSMKHEKYGRILNISSIWGIVGKEYRTSYSVSKFGLDGLTVSLSAEFSRLNILTNSISPGFTNTELTQSILGTDGITKVTEMVPLGRLAEPEEIAKFAFWLTSPSNTYITGQNFAIDGGYTRV